MYRNYDFDHMPWFQISVRPETELSVRRSTKVTIWILLLLVLGLFCVALTPETSHANAAAHQAQPQHKVQLKQNPHATAVPLPHHV